MITYVIVHKPSGDTYNTYSGITQEAIIAMASELWPGANCEFVDSSTYAAVILAHQPVPITPAQILASLRSGALDNLNASTDSVSKLQRAILMVVLDEINILRALLPGPPAPRTINQFKNAVQAKINGGTAD